MTTIPYEPELLPRSQGFLTLIASDDISVVHMHAGRKDVWLQERDNPNNLWQLDLTKDQCEALARAVCNGLFQLTVNRSVQVSPLEETPK